MAAPRRNFISAASQRFTNLLTCQIIIWPAPRYSLYPATGGNCSALLFTLIRRDPAPNPAQQLLNCPYSHFFVFHFVFIFPFSLFFLPTLLFYTTFTLSVCSCSSPINSTFIKSFSLTIWACRQLMGFRFSMGFTVDLKYARDMATASICQAPTL